MFFIPEMEKGGSRRPPSGSRNPDDRKEHGQMKERRMDCLVQDRRLIPTFAQMWRDRSLHPDIVFRIRRRTPPRKKKPL
ncbi:hypothetical protein BOX30_06160 [Leptospirillum ferriphilum]|uniref:Uncharacterized protein n=1 Tax=Leptospirillum ferriphilum TaxID=178606 RepID=A0A1V3STC8_9BACT|nr:hypothetical protein ABH19_06810 [Leptospirillum sp. Group II 'CF-1']OOH71193.1 hypothetical protein BOX24_09110 [Leptospirillum ferriphilum]OOH80282.1 hypothetical protein BOX30_06160 [Leptospirillum ferriphilum]